MELRVVPGAWREGGSHCWTAIAPQLENAPDDGRPLLWDR